MELDASMAAVRQPPAALQVDRILPILERGGGHIVAAVGSIMVDEGDMLTSDRLIPCRQPGCLGSHDSIVVSWRAWSTHRRVLICRVWCCGVTWVVFPVQQRVVWAPPGTTFHQSEGSAAVILSRHVGNVKTGSSCKGIESRILIDWRGNPRVSGSIWEGQPVVHLPYHNERRWAAFWVGYGALPPFPRPFSHHPVSPHLGANGSLSKPSSPSPKEPLPHGQGGRDFPSSPTNCIPTSNTSAAAIGNFHVWPIDSVVRDAIPTQHEPSPIP